MKLSTILGIIQTIGAIITIVMIFILFNKIKSFQGSPIDSQDTTIVTTYDTNIYKVENKTIVKEGSVYYKQYDTTIVMYAGMCDTVRVYTIEDGNDSIDIYGKIHTLGVLLDRDISYKWKLPYQKEIRITEYKPKNGLLLGIGAMYKDDIQLGLHAGFCLKNTNYSAGYYTDGTVSLQVNRLFILPKKKKWPDL